MELHGIPSECEDVGVDLHEILSKKDNARLDLHDILIERDDIGVICATSGTGSALI
jgi:hypothetical protein